MEGEDGNSTQLQNQPAQSKEDCWWWHGFFVWVGSHVNYFLLFTSACFYLDFKIPWLAEAIFDIQTKYLQK